MTRNSVIRRAIAGELMWLELARTRGTPERPARRLSPPRCADGTRNRLPKAILDDPGERKVIEGRQNLAARSSVPDGI